MKRIRQGSFVLAICALTNGCAYHALAPGAEQVRLIRSPTDVTACTAVGNVNWQGGREDIRNLTVGLGGNALFVTREALGDVMAGVAYRCP